MKAAIYVRVSTMEQAEEGYSLDEQIEKLSKYCEIKGWYIYKIYKDGGFSGANTDRPGLSDMIKDAKQQNFDTVLVYKLDRLSRSQKDTLYLIEDILGKNNIAFVSLNENFDTSTAFGKAMIGILAVFAQLEREQIRDRLLMGKVGRARSGKAMAWGIPPFGYILPESNREKYEIVPVQAEIVKKIYNDYLAGKLVSKICEELNASGHIGKGKPWVHANMKRTLTNPVYAGYISYRGEVFEANHEPIVSKKTFDLVQEQIEIRQERAYQKNNNPRPFQAKYLLSGLMKCGVCGARFEIVQYKPKADGSRIRYYKCVTQSSKTHALSMWKNPDGCTSPKYYVNDLEHKLLTELEKLKDDPRLVKSYSNESNKIDVNALDKRLNTLNNQLKKLVTLFIDNDYPKDVIESKKKEIIDEKKLILEKKNYAEKDKPEVSSSEALYELDQIKVSMFDLEYEDQKRIARKLIKEIVIYPNKMEIHWAFAL